MVIVTIVTWPVKNHAFNENPCRGLLGGRLIPIGCREARITGAKHREWGNDGEWEIMVYSQRWFRICNGKSVCKWMIGGVHIHTSTHIYIYMLYWICLVVNERTYTHTYIYRLYYHFWIFLVVNEREL